MAFHFSALSKQTIVHALSLQPKQQGYFRGVSDALIPVQFSGAVEGDSLIEQLLVFYGEVLHLHLVLG